MVRKVAEKAKRYMERMSYARFRLVNLLRIDQASAVDKETQILLTLKFREMKCSGFPLPKLEDVGFRSFSQTNEDGILLYIFSLIGTKNRTVVEACVDNGIECNAANLIINHGWTALLFEGNADQVKRGKRFYAAHKDTRIFPPAFVHGWIDAENINSLIMVNGFCGEIDLLSIDIDGMDYWIWKAINCVIPRVVVVEYQDIWGADEAVTVPYRRDFERSASNPEYAGASLAALVKLGREKGYRLVGCNNYCFNAIFMRSDVGEDIFPEVSPEDCLQHPRVKQRRDNLRNHLVKYEWMEV